MPSTTARPSSYRSEVAITVVTDGPAALWLAAPAHVDVLVEPAKRDETGQRAQDRTNGGEPDQLVIGGRGNRRDRWPIEAVIASSRQRVVFHTRFHNQDRSRNRPLPAALNRQEARWLSMGMGHTFLTRVPFASRKYYGCVTESRCSASPL